VSRERETVHVAAHHQHSSLDDCTTFVPTAAAILPISHVLCLIFRTCREFAVFVDVHPASIELEVVFST
jgi:hypothetical protein